MKKVQKIATLIVALIGLALIVNQIINNFEFVL